MSTMTEHLQVSPISSGVSDSIFLTKKVPSSPSCYENSLESAPARKKQRPSSSPIDISSTNFEVIDEPEDVSIDFEDVNEDLLARLIAAELELICERNRKDPYQPSKKDPIGIFFSNYRQPFSLETYFLRVIRYMDCSKAAFIVALVYLDRLQRLDSRFIVSYFNVHRLFLTASVIAAKYLDDSVYKNTHYAFVGGVPCLKEMNLLEEGMLYLLDFNASVDSQTFLEYRAIFKELE